MSNRRAAHDRADFRESVYSSHRSYRPFGRWRDDCRVRFLIAGGAATLINWLVRFPFDLLMPYAAAVAAAAACHMVCAFVLYRAWVFPGSDRPLMMQVGDFILINLVSMAVTVAISVAFKEILVSLQIRPVIAAAVAHFIGIGTGAIAGYIGHRRITFRSQRDALQSSMVRAPGGAAAPAE